MVIMAQTDGQNQDERIRKVLGLDRAGQGEAEVRCEDHLDVKHMHRTDSSREYLETPTVLKAPLGYTCVQHSSNGSGSPE